MQNFDLENVDCHATLAIVTKNTQSGRSMIEMLGVLAIIGVLSVGGIAGYSKAMTKYRINKTIEQITLIAGNVRTFFAPQRSYDDLGDNYMTIMRKARLVPDEMWDDNHLEDLWGGSVELLLPSECDGKCFEIYYDGDVSQEECIELVSHDWKNAGVKMINTLAGDSYYFIPPASIDDAVKICDGAGGGHDVEMHYYFEINTSDNSWKEKIENTKTKLDNL